MNYFQLFEPCEGEIDSMFDDNFPSVVLLPPLHLVRIAG